MRRLFAKGHKGQPGMVVPSSLVGNLPTPYVAECPSAGVVVDFPPDSKVSQGAGKSVKPAAKRERKQAGPRVFTAEEVAELLSVPTLCVERALVARLSFFTGSWQKRETKEWVVPEKCLRALLGGELQRWISVQTFASLFDVHVRTIKRAIQQGKLESKHLFSEVRIPESEYWRLARPQESTARLGPGRPSFFAGGES